MSIPSTDHDETTETGEEAFTLRIGGRTVHADRNDELLAAVIGEEYLDEDDPELLFLVRLEKAVMIATAVQESVVAAAVEAGDLDESTDEETWTTLLAERESAHPGVRWSTRYRWCWSRPCSPRTPSVTGRSETSPGSTRSTT